MNKLIYTIVLTAVVFSPLSLISLVTSAAAHHTSSHASTIALETTKARKKKIRTKQGVKSTTTGIRKQKPAATDATTQPPVGEAMPDKSTKPTTAAPESKIKTNGTGVDGSMPNPDKMIKVPGTGVPTLPSGASTPDVSKPSLPTVPKLPN
jgi:hypothetical protein